MKISVKAVRLLLQISDKLNALVRQMDRQDPGLKDRLVTKQKQEAARTAKIALRRAIFRRRLTTIVDV